MPRLARLMLAASLLSGPALAGKRSRQETPPAELDPVAAEAFAKRLQTTIVEPTMPPGASVSAGFHYTIVSFGGDGTWVAPAMSMSFDVITECTESGTWVLTAMESEDVGAIEWVTTATDCPDRSAGGSSQATVTFKEGLPTVVMNKL